MTGDTLIQLAKTRPVLSDGAMGTMLQEFGLQAGGCPELWNVEKPEAVRAVHAAYIEAGSRMISTNTFGGSRLKLAAYGLADRAAELNTAGAAIAREAAGADNFVAGSVGPTGEFLEPLGDLAFEEAADIFAEQAQALASGGADIILLETFSDLQEAKAALEGALRSGLPCFCTFAFDTGGRTMMGLGPVEAAVELSNAGAAGVGANCGVGPKQTLDTIAQIRNATRGIVIAQPNAGLPKVVQGRTTYDSTPEEMADFAIKSAQLGVNIIGACCGSTPQHIRAMAAAIESFHTG